MTDRLFAVGALAAGTALSLALARVPDVVAYLPPLSALLLLAAFILAFPGFLGERLRLPHAFLLPLSFTAFSLAIGTFWDLRGGAIVVANQKLALAQYLLAPSALMLTFCSQALALALAAWRKERARRA